MKKHYYTFTELCDILDVKPHIVRYWENEIPKLKKKCTKGTTRRYSNKEVDLYKRIHELFFVKKLTMAGVKNELKKRKVALSDIKKELQEIRDMLIHP